MVLAGAQTAARALRPGLPAVPLYRVAADVWAVPDAGHSDVRVKYQATDHGSLSATDRGFQLDGRVLWVERQDALLQQLRAAQRKVVCSRVPQRPAELPSPQAVRPELRAESALVQPQERLVLRRARLQVPAP
jgi:hypothetical protein